MTLSKLTSTAALILAAGASAAQAQTYSGGRQGPGGRGYSYNVTRSGSTVTGSVQTNAGYGATASHSGGYNAYGAYRGTTTVTANNGAAVTTNGAAKNGYYGGTVKATGPNGQSYSAVGGVYAPR